MYVHVLHNSTFSPWAVAVHSYILEDDQTGLHSTMVKESVSLHHAHNQEAMIDTTQSAGISFSTAGESMEAEVGNSVMTADLGENLHTRM